MEKFEIKVRNGENFTAASLMYRYAKENNAEHSYYYGRSVLIIHGAAYGFDHWEIADNGDDTETVAVFLFPCGHLMRRA